jgi:hypothetical protein
LASTDGPMPGRRERAILAGLLAGVALLRPAAAPLAGGHLVIGLDDYSAVHESLMSSSVQPADEDFDPLTVAMVQRANAYLHVRASESGGRLARSDGGGIEMGLDGITRREIADIGNVGGPTVRKLVAALLGKGDDGFKTFKSIGTVQSARDGAGWPDDRPEMMAARLLPWTEKQVRTHFHRLHADGVITASRAAANQPWRYRLPEAFARSRSPFRLLPRPELLATAAAQRAAAAAGPSPARPGGQTEPATSIGSGNGCKAPAPPARV